MVPAWRWTGLSQASLELPFNEVELATSAAGDVPVLQFGEPAARIECVRLVSQPARVQHASDRLQRDRQVGEAVEHLLADNEIEGLVRERRAVGTQVGEFWRSPAEPRTPLLGELERDAIRITDDHVIVLVRKIDSLIVRIAANGEHLGAGIRRSEEFIDNFDLLRPGGIIKDSLKGVALAVMVAFSSGTLGFEDCPPLNLPVDIYWCPSLSRPSRASSARAFEIR